ncbi:MAG: hypothetical protein JJU33_08395 [Phycisphaerales bacterium]|nr:hypothetical protein [Phycisphaerales bacterium]
MTTEPSNLSPASQVMVMPPEEDLLPHPTRPAREVMARRELFWHNVMRDFLMGMSMMSVKRASAPYDPEVEQTHKSTFDGRIGVITTLGARIPIGEVHPMFACSISGTEAERRLSEEVQCTVFQIRTPSGEIHTLPLHEMRSLHALTPELIEAIEAQMEQNGTDKSKPFGFAAFTSLQNSEGDGNGGLEEEVPFVDPIIAPTPADADLNAAGDEP